MLSYGMAERFGQAERIKTMKDHCLIYKPTNRSPKALPKHPALDAFSRPEQLILHCAPNAVSANEFTRRGGDFNDAQMQMIVSDMASSLAFDMTIRIYGHAALAYYVCPTGFGGTSVEVLMSDEVAREALSFYNKLPMKITRKTVERIAAKHEAVRPLLGVIFDGERVPPPGLIFSDDGRIIGITLAVEVG